MSMIILFIVRLLDIYIWAIIATVLMSWLVAFEVLNLRNKWARKFYEFMNAVTQPPMNFVRRYVPPIGGIDLTPMVVIFGIYIIQHLLISLLY